MIGRRYVAILLVRGYLLYGYRATYLREFDVVQKTHLQSDLSHASSITTSRCLAVVAEPPLQNLIANCRKQLTMVDTTPLVPSEKGDEVKIGHKYCGKSLAVPDTTLLLHRMQSKIRPLSSSLTHLSSSSSVVLLPISPPLRLLLRFSTRCDYL